MRDLEARWVESFVGVGQFFSSFDTRPDHLHMLVLDGVYTWEHGRPRFHRVPAPNRKCLERLGPPDLASPSTAHP